MNIAIVNDVSMISLLLSEVIKNNSHHNVIWTALNGEQAVSLASEQTPDMIIMDLIMPGMDGVEATRQIMQHSPCAILIVTADVTYNADMVFTAMSYGAIDAISTPSLGSTDNQEDIGEFLYKLSIIEQLLKDSQKKVTHKIPRVDSSSDNDYYPVVCIGASTGGPGALARILSDIPDDFRASIIIIQHVDNKFTSGLAEWLDTQCKLEVSVAKKHEKPAPGKVYLAGGDLHLKLSSKLKFEYTAEPEDYAYRPSVDIFFNSIARYWKGSKIGVLLTGMGNDGANGMLALKQQQASTIAQNQDSCAVFGMPRAAIRLDAASHIMQLDDIASCLQKLVDASTPKTGKLEASNDK